MNTLESENVLYNTINVLLNGPTRNCFLLGRNIHCVKYIVLLLSHPSSSQYITSVLVSCSFSKAKSRKSRWMFEQHGPEK